MQNMTKETLNYQRKKKNFEFSHLEGEEVVTHHKALGWCQRAWSAIKNRFYGQVVEVYVSCLTHGNCFNEEKNGDDYK